LQTTKTIFSQNKYFITFIIMVTLMQCGKAKNNAFSQLFLQYLLR